MNTRMTTRVMMIGVLFVIATLNGCVVAGFVAHTLKDESIPAVYTLQQRPTVILVDDPHNQLGPDQVSVDMAAAIGSYLVEKEMLKTVISQQKVNDLRQGLDKKFDSQPVDVIGRDVGAHQVIHVHVRSVNYMAQPGMIQPKATVLVKVIDVNSRKRLFPPADAEVTQSKLPIFKGGFVMTAQMRERVLDSIGAEKQMKVFQGRLGGYTARKVAEIFYKHQPEDRLKGDN